MSLSSKLYYHYYSALSRTSLAPLYLIMFVSDKCWTACRHCWYNEEKKQETNCKQFLQVEAYEKIAKQINKIDFLSITGGEAFAREDLLGIIEPFVKYNKIRRFDIPTSGFDTSQIITKTEKILKLAPHLPFRVDVSLDGAQATHDYIRQREGSFDHAMETLKELLRLKKHYKNLDVSMITTINGYNEHETDEIANVINTNLTNGEWFINLIRDNPRDINSNLKNFENYIKLSRLADERVKRNDDNRDTSYFYGKMVSAKNILRREIITEVYNGEMKGGGCSAGSLIGVLGVDGTVFPCETLNENYGNIRDYNYNFQAIWENENADRIRKSIQQTKCVCTHECFLSINIITRPNLLLRLINKRLLG